MPSNWRCSYVSMISFLSLLTLQGPYEWGWRMHPMWGWGWGIGMMTMMLLFWGAISCRCMRGIRWFVGQSKPSRGRLGDGISCRERFASGEIDKDEFETKKRELT